MKRKEKDGMKNHTVDELKVQLRQAREKRFGLNFKHSTAPLANPLELRAIRRRIAMLETFIQEKGATVASKTATKK